MSEPTEQAIVATMQALSAHLVRYRHPLTSEFALQDSLERVLTLGMWTFERERVLGDEGRIDFLVKRDGVSIGLEVKVRASATSVIRQLHGYAQHADVHGLLLVTSSMQLATIAGTGWPKPVRTLHLIGSVL